MTPIARGKSRLVAAQDVLRDDVLARACVTLALVDRRNWRPVRTPAPLLARMEAMA